jgi:hypothetical protein
MALIAGPPKRSACVMEPKIRLNAVWAVMMVGFGMLLLIGTALSA